MVENTLVCGTAIKSMAKAFTFGLMERNIEAFIITPRRMAMVSLNGLTVEGTLASGKMVHNMEKVYTFLREASAEKEFGLMVL